jgi:hypothetical protein
MAGKTKKRCFLDFLLFLKFFLDFLDKGSILSPQLTTVHQIRQAGYLFEGTGNRPRLAAEMGPETMHGRWAHGQDELGQVGAPFCSA